MWLSNMNLLYRVAHHLEFSRFAMFSIDPDIARTAVLRYQYVMSDCDPTPT